MSRVGGRIGGYGPENELRRTIQAPVACWRREWVVPSVIARPGAEQQESTDGKEPATPLKILKWVRTSEVVHFDPPEVDIPMASADAPPQSTDAMSAQTAPRTDGDNKSSMPMDSNPASGDSAQLASGSAAMGVPQGGSSDNAPKAAALAGDAVQPAPVP